VKTKRNLEVVVSKRVTYWHTHLCGNRQN